MAMEPPPLDTIPTPGAWITTPADLVGGFLLGWARRFDAIFPLRIWEKLVRFVWDRVQAGNRAEVILEVGNCGYTFTVTEAGSGTAITFHRMSDGSYINLDDPIRASTGAAMHYRFRTQGRGTLVGDSILDLAGIVDIAAATQELELVGGQSDYWLTTCQLPELSTVDGPVCE
jgi:hypothetical protein